MSDQQRLDAILAPEYLAGLAERTTDEIRSLRDEAEEHESGISYARRLLQGKLDILRAEAFRRRDEGESVTTVLEALPSILADQPRPAVGSLPFRVPRHVIPPSIRRPTEQADELVGAGVVAELASRSTDELAELVRQLAERERELSATRRALLDRIDQLQDELTRRYKAGTADVGDVLVPRR